MLPEEELKKGEIRLLEVDEKVFLPVKVNIGFITTSDDVIHS
jgi:heme/copper-type cytochrome/quinol oxidase subunit 2